MSKVAEGIGVAAMAAAGAFIGYAAVQMTQLSLPEVPASVETEPPALPAPPPVSANSPASQPPVTAPAPPADRAPPVPITDTPPPPAPAPEPPAPTPINFDEWETLSPQILEVVEELAASKTGLGYDRRHYYTEDLSYGDYTLAEKGDGETMCVAAVAEIMIRAIDKYADANPQYAVFDALPGSMWERASLSDLRPWLYVFKLDKTIPTYNRAYGSGTHDALILFGIGRGVKFSEAKPGDLVNFNRVSGSGHAAVFLGYVKPGYEVTNTYSDEVIGFRYFSAQGSGVSGLDYRHAFFGNCPAERKEGIRRDCKIIRTDNPGLFSMSRLHAPPHWRTQDFMYFMDKLFDDGASFAEIQAARYEGAPKEARTRSLGKMLEFSQDLPEEFAMNFSGEMDEE